MAASGWKGESPNSPILPVCEGGPTARKKKTNSYKTMKTLAAISWASEVGKMIKSEAHKLSNNCYSLGASSLFGRQPQEEEQRSGKMR